MPDWLFNLGPFAAAAVGAPIAWRLFAKDAVPSALLCCLWTAIAAAGLGLVGTWVVGSPLADESILAHLTPELVARGWRLSMRPALTGAVVAGFVALGATAAWARGLHSHRAV